MILDLSKVKIFIKPGPTDFRKQINGLSLLVQEECNMNALDGSLYLFCNRTKNRIKILYWDRNGFCLWLKRLEKERFPWPKNEKELFMITENQLSMLLDGIDFFHAHKTLSYRGIS